MKTNMSCSLLLSATEISPIDIRAQFFAAHRAKRFALNVYAEAIAEFLTGRNCLSDVANRRFAAFGKFLLLLWLHCVDECKKSFHVDMLPLGNVQSNTHRPFTGR